MQDGTSHVASQPESPALDAAIPAHEIDATIFAQEIEAELKKILASPPFRRAERSSQFLDYVVRMTLAGSAGMLKEHAIGVRAFRLGSDEYDPLIDNKVRVEAGRLRSRLAAYYEELGQHDPIRIDLPKGTYVPTFSRNGVVQLLPKTEREASSPAPAADTLVVRKGRAWWLAVAAVLAVASAAAVYFVTRKSARLGERDIVVLADFVNRTGDPVFDDTLKTALSVALRQSPFLNVLPDNKVASTLQLMARPANAALTPEVAREVCERANATASVVGSIVALGNSYVLGLKAANCVTGDLLAQEQVTAPAKEKVLDSLGRAASKLRGQLGESLATVQRYDVPLEQATTPSLEALKEYSIYYKHGDVHELPHLRRAVELDPNFAMGYVGLGWHYWGVSEIGEASQYFTKAFQLREHASKLERLRITADYYTNVSGELDKAQQIYAELTANYPRNADVYPWNIATAAEGRYEEELVTYHNFLLQNPLYFMEGGDGFGTTFLAIQRLDEARQAFQKAQKRGDNFLVHTGLYALAFLEGDSRVMAEQQEWYAKQGAYRTFGLALASDTELYGGRLRQAEVLTGEAEQYAMREDWKETAAIWQQNTAIGAAAVGDAKESRGLAAAALEMAPTSPAVEAEAAIAFAMSDETVRAAALAKELNQRLPKDTQMQALWLPAVRAQVALDQKDPSAAISELQNTLPPIEYGQIMFLNNISCLYHTYIRGQAFLAARQGEAAAAEFQKILDHSGIVWNCWTGSLARLGLARANALQARTLQGAEADAARTRSLAAYKDFLILWKDADPDIPIYRQAKAEYARLQ